MLLSGHPIEASAAGRAGGELHGWKTGAMSCMDGSRRVLLGDAVMVHPPQTHNNTGAQHVCGDEELLQTGRCGRCGRRGRCDRASQPDRVHHQSIRP